MTRIRCRFLFVTSVFFVYNYDFLSYKDKIRKQNTWFFLRFMKKTVKQKGQFLAVQRLIKTDF